MEEETCQEAIAIFQCKMTGMVGTRTAGEWLETRYTCKTVSIGHVTDDGLGVQDEGGVSGLTPRRLGG